MRVLWKLKPLLHKSCLWTSKITINLLVSKKELQQNTCRWNRIFHKKGPNEALNMAKELEFGYKKGYSSQVFFIWLWQLLISRVTPQFDGIFVEFENPRGNHIQNNSAQTCSELRVETFSSSIKLHRQKKFHSFFNRIFLARFLLCGFFRLLRS